MNEDVLLTDYRKTGLGNEASRWIDNASNYHSPEPAAVSHHKNMAVSSGCMLAAILKNCPPSRDRTIALNKVREARMWANSAIATEGKI